MSIQATKLSVIVASLALTLVCATELRAQISNYLRPRRQRRRRRRRRRHLPAGSSRRRTARCARRSGVIFRIRPWRSVGVERPGRDVDGGVVIRRQHESSAFERDRYAEKLCVAACDRYPRIVRHQQRDERPDLEDSRGRSLPSVPKMPY